MTSVGVHYGGSVYELPLRMLGGEYDPAHGVSGPCSGIVMNSSVMVNLVVSLNNPWKLQCPRIVDLTRSGP